MQVLQCLVVVILIHHGHTQDSNDKPPAPTCAPDLIPTSTAAPQPEAPCQNGEVLRRTLTNGEFFVVKKCQKMYTITSKDDGHETCKNSGAMLATLAQLTEAFDNKFSYCVCGWVADSDIAKMAIYGAAGRGCGRSNTINDCKHTMGYHGATSIGNGWDAYCFKPKKVQADVKLTSMAFGTPDQLPTLTTEKTTDLKVMVDISSNEFINNTGGKNFKVLATLHKTDETGKVLAEDLEDAVEVTTDLNAKPFEKGSKAVLLTIPLKPTEVQCMKGWVNYVCVYILPTITSAWTDINPADNTQCLYIYKNIDCSAVSCLPKPSTDESVKTDKKPYSVSQETSGTVSRGGVFSTVMATIAVMLFLGRSA